MAGKEAARLKLYPVDISGADARDRTADLLITNQLLYRLSYIGFASCDKSVCFEVLPIYRNKYPLSSLSCTLHPFRHGDQRPNRIGSTLTFKTSLI